MSISSLKSSTAAVLCLSLMQPLPGLAQVSLEGAVEATGADELAQTVADEAVEAAAAAAQAAADKAAADEVAAVAAQAAADKVAADEAAAAAEAQAAAEKAAADEAAATAAVQAAADKAAADEAAAAAEAQAAADKAAADEAAAAAEAQAAAEKAAADEAAATAAVQAAAGKAAADEAAAAAEAQAAADKAAADEAAAVAEAQAAAEKAAADEAAAAAEAQAATDASVQAEAEAAGTVEAETAADGDAQAGEAGGEQLTDAERQERAQQNEAQSSAAADATAESEAEAEIETQTVTEEDVRSSTEDFATGVTGDAEATTTAAAAAAPGKKKGLSNFEKALLLGLGAAVVGTVLANGDRVMSNSGDRVVVERDGELRVLKNDDELLRRPGAEVSTQTFRDGSTRTTVAYDDGSQIVTVRASDGTVLRRTRIRASDGKEFVLFDDTREVDPVDFDRLPSLETIAARQSRVAMNDEAALQKALREVMFADVDRRFSLRQVRDYKRVRALAPQVELDAITFATGSAAIQPSQAQALADLGGTMRRIIEENPRAVFLVEGHTDAVGDAGYNLALSDRRAETVALALTEYFDVPPQNLITQGYGESDLKVPSLAAERANRRAAVRNITALLN